MIRKILYLALIIIVFNINLEAQEYNDSTKVYKLGEILVTSDKSVDVVYPSSIGKVTRSALQKSDAITFQDLNGLIPSSNITKNSRGEALMTIRGMGDRRSSIFFDGALLNNQWDRRFDLSLLPTELISKITVTNGSSSILYGANTLAGCIDISTVERSVSGFGGSLNLLAGNGPYGSISVMQNGKISNFNYIVNFSYLDSKGMVLSDESFQKANDINSTELMNQDKNSKLRTNSDKKLYTIYGRTEYAFEKISLGLSYFRIGSDFGVAPQGNELNPRFWRTDDYTRNMLTFNSKIITSNETGSHFRATVWFDNSILPIDEYTDINYKNIDSSLSTLDNTNTLGSRFIYNLNTNSPHSFKAVGTAYYTSNNEKLKNKTSSLDFSELIYDGGIEYDFRSKIGLNITAGGLVTGQITPKAGAFPEVNGRSVVDWSAMLGASYLFTSEINVFSNISRKVTFPSLRQAFANPPKKFAPNPDLKAESGILTELGLKYQTSRVLLQPTIFYNSFVDLLAKIKSPNDPQKRYIRTNLSEAEIYGAELNYDYSPSNNFKVWGTLTYMKSSGKLSPESEATQLEYVPEYLAYFNMRYSFMQYASTQVELDFAGKQYGLNLDGVFEEISPSLLLNIRMGWTFSIKEKVFTEFFVRCNNILDKERIQILGLPSAGRTFAVGLKTNL